MNRINVSDPASYILENPVLMKCLNELTVKILKIVTV